VTRTDEMTARPSRSDFGVDCDTDVDIDAIFDPLTAPGTERHLESDEYDIVVFEAATTQVRTSTASAPRVSPGLRTSA
jgi:hypothetical protein